MNNLAWIVKYRATNFSDLCGHEVALKPLTDGITNGTLTNMPILLSGKYGVGKSSVATAIKLALNCKYYDRQNLKSCQKCSACINGLSRATTFDSIPDINCADATLKTIAEIERRMGTSASFNYWIFILDEVHQLNEKLQTKLNTIIDTLRPSCFIIAATRITAGLDESFDSRFMHIKLQPPDYYAIRTILQRIIRAEGVKVPEKALDAIVFKNLGKPRDAIVALEKYVLTH